MTSGRRAPLPPAPAPPQAGRVTAIADPPQAGRVTAIDCVIAWAAVRAAGGSIPTAASALGVSPRELLDILRTDRGIRLGSASGTRRRVAADPEASGEPEPEA